MVDFNIRDALQRRFNRQNINQAKINVQSSAVNPDASGNNSTQNLVKQVHSNIINNIQQQMITPQTVRMNHLASVDRSTYIKNLLNLPDNITDLLITFGNDKTEAQMKEALKQNQQVLNNLNNIIQQNQQRLNLQEALQNQRSNFQQNQQNQIQQGQQNQGQNQNNNIQQPNQPNQNVNNQPQVQPPYVPPSDKNNNSGDKVQQNQQQNNQNQNGKQEQNDIKQPQQNRPQQPSEAFDKTMQEQIKNNNNQNPPQQVGNNKPQGELNKPAQNPQQGQQGQIGKPNQNPQQPNLPNNNRPNVPNQPTPPQPSVPNRPNVPNRPMPPQPSVPNRPNVPNQPMPPQPSVPNRPNVPNQPMPPQPSVPNRPNVPNQPMPPQPSVPNRPNVPNQPMPPQPSVPNRPNVPNQPTPPQPSVPNRPNVPNQPMPPQPSVPNRPNVPNQPMPPQPSVPNRPNVPNQPTPPQPSVPNRPNVPNQPMPPQPNIPNISNRPSHKPDGVTGGAANINDSVINEPEFSNPTPRPTPAHVNHRLHSQLINDARFEHMSNLRDSVRNHIRRPIELRPQAPTEQLQEEVSQELKQLQAQETAQIAQKQVAAKVLPSKVNLSVLNSQIQQHSKQALNNLVLEMSTATRQGITDTRPIQDTISLINSSISASSQDDTALAIKNLMLLYLPWLPLEEGVGFKLDVTTKKAEPPKEDDTSISIMITTKNYGNIGAEINLLTTNSVDIFITCDKTFPKEELLKRLNRDSKEHSMTASIGVEEISQQNSLEPDVQKAKVNLSNVTTINPYLLLMSHSFIRHAIEIDINTTMYGQPVES